jgi:hypothetical protein
MVGLRRVRLANCGERVVVSRNQTLAPSYVFESEEVLGRIDSVPASEVHDPPLQCQLPSSFSDSAAKKCSTASTFFKIHYMWCLQLIG